MKHPSPELNEPGRHASHGKKHRDSDDPWERAHTHPYLLQGNPRDLVGSIRLPAIYKLYKILLGTLVLRRGLTYPFPQ